jgi:DNA helicase-2/ATP-dependent DNA helicase PcrA
MTFDQFLKTELNAEQRSAVTHKEGPLLVIAGAGSGKTRVITARITHLILNEQVSPHQIIALTFTNKAAQEMKERIHHFLKDTYSALPFVGTFHAYCLLLLKKNVHLLETPFFSILDEDDRSKLLNSVIKHANMQKQITATHLGYQISHIKNHALIGSDLTKDNPILAQLHAAYEEEKKQSKCLDFDDLLLLGVQLFEKNKEFKALFQQTIRHILVDEYQDTNVVQHALLKHMAKHGNKLIIESVCVVGDEDQSIYSWRGATIANIIHFKKDFPQTTVVTIEQNYRSVEPILEVANHIIAHNTERNPKKLWSERKGTDRIRALSFLSEYQEAQAIAQLLKIARTQKKNSIALLYRTHFQSRALEEALMHHSIPYKIIGGINFYERKEIKDILAYARLMVNPFDRPSLLRIINCPTRGLGTVVQELIHDVWRKEPFLSFDQLLNKLIQDKVIIGQKANTIKKFCILFETISLQHTPAHIIEHFVNNTHYLTYLKNSYDEQEAQERIDNVKELINAVTYMQTQNIQTIEQFLDQVALMQEHTTGQDSSQHPVLLMTLHAAKGLEFELVIITGLEDGLLPSSRSLQEPDKIEEERRLFYVGITRAQERLLISRSRYRYSYGQMNAQMPSRFLSELPNHLVQEHDASQTHEAQQRLFFTDWLNNALSKTVRASVNTVHKSSTITQATTLAKPMASIWKIHQPVKHSSFGVGTIKKIETKADTVYLTINFKGGTKKVAAHFIEKI